MLKNQFVKIVVLAMLCLLVAGSAGAADGDGGSVLVTASVIGGERWISAAPSPVVMVPVAGTNTMTGALAFTVTELVRTGTDGWFVTAQLDADMVNLADATKTITRSNMSVSPVSVLPVGGGGDITLGSAGTLDGAVTLFTNDNQDTLTAYTGTYVSASTMNLTIPNGTATGVYNGTITISLIQ